MPSTLEVRSQNGKRSLAERTASAAEDQKTCPRCKFIKDITNFYKDKSTTSGRCAYCKKCHSEVGKEHYKNNRERILERMREGALLNPEKIRAIQSKSYYKNREKIKQKHKIWREKNRKAHNIYMKSWRDKNLEKARFWTSVSGHNRRLRMVVSDNPITFVQWNKLKKKHGGICFYCGKKKKLTQDHFIPLTMGGSHNVSNIVPACKSCNSRKYNTMPDVYLKKIGRN